MYCITRLTQPLGNSRKVYLVASSRVHSNIHPVPNVKYVRSLKANAKAYTRNTGTVTSIVCFPKLDSMSKDRYVLGYSIPKVHHTPTESDAETNEIEHGLRLTEISVFSQHLENSI